MDIVVGVIYLCTMVTGFDYSSYKMFVKNVETKVHHITPKGDALIQYNLKKHKHIVYSPNDDLFDIVKIADMQAKDYMNCKKGKDE